MALEGFKKYSNFRDVIYARPLRNELFTLSSENQALLTNLILDLPSTVLPRYSLFLKYKSAKAKQPLSKLSLKVISFHIIHES
jgi:hypothetical protein